MIVLVATIRVMTMVARVMATGHGDDGDSGGGGDNGAKLQ
jgi:hypothetical protein